MIIKVDRKGVARATASRSISAGNIARYSMIYYTVYSALCVFVVDDPGIIFRASGKHIRARARARALIVAKPFVYKSCLHTRRLPHARSEVFTNAESSYTRSPSQTRKPRHAQPRRQSRHMRDPLKYECSYMRDSYTCEHTCGWSPGLGMRQNYVTKRRRCFSRSNAISAR